jgi:hypothetical protein
VTAHGALADRAAARPLTRPCLRRRGVDDDQVHRRVVAAGAAQHGAPQPRVCERPHDDHALRPRERTPDREPVTRVDERSPQRVGQASEPRRPRLAQRVAVERARLAGDQRRLAGPGQAGDDDHGGGVG